jgi:hypothetical protein
MTRSFDAVERFFERLLERPMARLFRAPVQPVQLQRQVERAMDGGRLSVAGRTWVPNRFRVLLSPTDVSLLEDERAGLQAELEEAVARRAQERGYRLVERPEVIVLPSPGVGEGDVSVEAEPLDPGLVRSAAAGLRPVEVAAPRPPRPPIPGTAPVPDLAAPAGAILGPAQPAAPPWAPPAEGPPRAGRPPSPTAPLPPPAPAAPAAIAAIVEVRSPLGPAWAFAFRGGVARIGRGSDNDIILPDDRVSRRHGQLTARQGTLVYTDLGSSNGSWVNGAAVREIALGVGDVLRIGDSTLIVRPGG